MALRLASQKLFSKQIVRSSVRAFSAATEEAPSVFDNLINLTIVDPSGARKKISGFVGKY